MHLFNKFMKEHPRPTAKTWEELAVLFKAKSNYLTIWPKLPSMLRKHCQTWRLNQELVMIKDSMKTDYYGLLKQLSQPSRNENSIVNSPAAAFQKNASDEQIEAPIGGDDLGETATEAAVADLPCDPMPVPPLAAPAQTGYVLSGDGRGKTKRRCSAAPFGCPRLAKDCSWNGWENCNLVKSKSIHVNVPETEEGRNRAFASLREGQS
jgi:hypothetical protein